MRKINLLIINDHGIQGGGTEARIRIFVEELLAKGICHEVHVLQHNKNLILSHMNKDKRMFFHSVNGGSTYDIVRKIIKEHTITLVQAHNLLALQPYCLIAAKLAGVPIVWWAHDYWLLCAKRSFIDPYNAMQEPLCKKAQKKVCYKCMSLKARTKHALWRRIMNFVDCAIAPAKILKDIHSYYDVLDGKWQIITPWIDSVFIKPSLNNKSVTDSLILSSGSTFSSAISSTSTTEEDTVNSSRPPPSTDRWHARPLRGLGSLALEHCQYHETTLGTRVVYDSIKSNGSKNYTLLFVGSLIEFKGAWVVAKALKHIVKDFPTTKLIFVGSEQETESKYRIDIEKICKDDGTKDCLVFLGKKNKKEIVALHKKADVYVCPTVCMESFGLNWAEAMAGGVAVVASAIGSIPEYIKDGETGLLFPPRNHLALAKQVCILLGDNNYRQKIAQNGKEYACKHFASGRATDELVALYKKILGEKEVQ